MFELEGLQVYEYLIYISSTVWILSVTAFEPTCPVPEDSPTTAATLNFKLPRPPHHEGMAFVLPAFHVGQAILASYTTLLSYTSIVKLNTYEEMSEKAASYSNTAEHQLHKTRTTMTSGALATLSSLLSPIALIVVFPKTEPRQLFLISMFNTAATAFAFSHIR